MVAFRPIRQALGLGRREGGIERLRGMGVHVIHVHLERTEDDRVDRGPSEPGVGGTGEVAHDAQIERALQVVAAMISRDQVRQGHGRGRAKGPCFRPHHGRRFLPRHRSPEGSGASHRYPLSFNGQRRLGDASALLGYGSPAFGRGDGLSR